MADYSWLLPFAAGAVAATLGAAVNHVLAVRRDKANRAQALLLDEYRGSADAIHLFTRTGADIIANRARPEDVRAAEEAFGKRFNPLFAQNAFSSLLRKDRDQILSCLDSMMDRHDRLQAKLGLETEGRVVLSAALFLNEDLVKLELPRRLEPKWELESKAN